MKAPKRYEEAKLSDLPPSVAIALNIQDVKPKPSFYLFGDIGTGKTHAAWAFVSLFDESKFRVLNVPNMLSSFRPDNLQDSDMSPDEIKDFEGYIVLDDLGVEKMSDWVSENLYKIVNHRYEHKLPTVVTSNLSLGEMSNHLGDRITSRLAEMCQVVELSGKDRRLD